MIKLFGSIFILSAIVFYFLIHPFKKTADLSLAARLVGSTILTAFLLYLLIGSFQLSSAAL